MTEAELKAEYRKVRNRLMRGIPVNRLAAPVNEHPARDRMRKLIERAKDIPQGHVPVQFMMMLADDDPTLPKWKRVAIEVCHANGVNLSELVGYSRSRHIVAVRHEVMWRLATQTDMSLTAIGRRLNRDHTTVLHGVRTHSIRHGAHNPFPYQEHANGRSSRAKAERVQLPRPDLAAWVSLGGANA